MIFNITDSTGAISGMPTVRVYDASGRLKTMGGTPVGSVAWGSITGTVTAQTDLITYLSLNFYPLSSNPAGYLTDAPSDGSTYGRKNGAWSAVTDVTPAALTKTDDTNVTLTLGGTPATALLQATSLTLGWTGTLATGRGGTGLSIIGTDGQLIRVNTGATALEYFTPTYLTAVPTLQEVLIAGSTLTQNNTVNGANFNFIWDVFNRYTINTDEYVLLNSTSGSKIATATVNALGVAPYIDLNIKNGVTNTGLYVDNTQVLIRTPGVDAATVSNGYVLTLTDAASGKVEFQNAATTGDSLSPLLLMGG